MARRQDITEKRCPVDSHSVNESVFAGLGNYAVENTVVIGEVRPRACVRRVALVVKSANKPVTNCLSLLLAPFSAARRLLCTLSGELAVDMR